MIQYPNIIPYVGVLYYPYKIHSIRIYVTVSPYKIPYSHKGQSINI